MSLYCEIYRAVHKDGSKDEWRNNHPEHLQREAQRKAFGWPTTAECGFTFAQAEQLVTHHKKTRYTSTEYAVAELPADYIEEQTKVSLVPYRYAVPSVMPTIIEALPKKAEGDESAEYIPTARKLAKDLKDEEIRILTNILREERTARELIALEAAKKEYLAKRYDECRASLAHLFTQMCHAMACRNALRWMAGHDLVGKEMQHGAMWTAAEGAELSRRFRNELPPKKRNAKTECTRLLSNPLEWQSDAEIINGCKKGLIGHANTKTYGYGGGMRW